MVTGIKLNSAGKYMVGAAGQFTGLFKRIMLRLRFDGKPTNGNNTILDLGGYGLTQGCTILGKDYSGQPSAPTGTISAYTDTVDNKRYHILTDGELGILKTLELWIANGKQWVALDGQLIDAGRTTTFANFASTLALGINTRCNVVPSLHFAGGFTLVELQLSTLAPASEDELIAMHLGAFNTPVAGMAKHWYSTGTHGAGVGATWVAQAGGTNLTVTGSPLYDTVVDNRVLAISLDARGDSRLEGRKSGGTAGDGWRKTAFTRVSALTGKSVIIYGANFPTGPESLDFNAENNGIGGKGLGVPTTGSPALDTLEAEVIAHGTRRTITYLAYGINDLTYRIDILNETIAQAVANLQQNYRDACAIIRRYRTGAIFIEDTLLSDSDGVPDPNVNLAALQFNSEFLGFIAELNATYKGVYTSRVAPTLTPNQAAADSGIYYDNVHHTPAAYITHGTVVGDTLSKALDVQLELTRQDTIGSKEALGIVLRGPFLNPQDTRIKVAFPTGYFEQAFTDGSLGQFYSDSGLVVDTQTLGTPIGIAENAGPSGPGVGLTIYPVTPEAFPDSYPYFVTITNGTSSEVVSVTGKSGTDRLEVTPALVNNYSAGSATVSLGRPDVERTIDLTLKRRPHWPTDFELSIEGTDSLGRAF